MDFKLINREKILKWINELCACVIPSERLNIEFQQLFEKAPESKERIRDFLNVCFNLSVHCNS